MNDKVIDQGGEGNRAADKRYRAGVRETVARTDERERAEKARSVSDDALREGRKAQEKARGQARD